MIPDSPGGLAWVAAGLPEEVLLEAWPHNLNWLFIFLRSSLPLEPCLTSTSQNNPVRVPFPGAALDCPSGAGGL